MSPGRNNNDILTIGSTQAVGSYIEDKETNYEWMDYLCILLKSGNYITIDVDNTVELKKPDRVFGQKFENRFFKLRVGIKPGTMWTKTFDYEVEDYQRILVDDDIIYRLENTIEPNPTYINEMKAELRSLQINKIV